MEKCVELEPNTKSRYVYTNKKYYWAASAFLRGTSSSIVGKRFCNRKKNGFLATNLMLKTIRIFVRI